MIFITGDTHGDMSVNRLGMKTFPEQKKLTKDDYVIIVGDFGIPFYGDKCDKYWLDWLDSRNFTTLFIDGNHENFDLLYSYEKEIWSDGIVHKLRDSVIHLTRGQVFNIDGLKFFTMGGAWSTDKMYRTPGKTWWAQELPDKFEMDLGLSTLSEYDFKVDYILTHSAPYDFVKQILGHDGEGNIYEKSFLKYLQFIYDETTFKHWYFGHYHKNMDLNDKLTLIYYNILQLDI